MDYVSTPGLDYGLCIYPWTGLWIVSTQELDYGLIYPMDWTMTIYLPLDWIMDYISTPVYSIDRKY